MALPVPSPSYAPASTVTKKSITTSSGPAQGGGGGGGGGGAVTSVNGQTGSVVLGASDVGADPAGSAATAQAIAEQYTRTAGIQYATGGNVQVQFGLGVIGVIQLSTNIVFSPAGSAGILPGCWQAIILANNTAGAFTITKNPNWVGVVPTSIAPGQTMAIFLQGSISPPASTDANIEVDVVVTTQATTSGVTQIVAGTGITVSPGGGTGVVTVNATGTTAGRTVFNIETYGAIANSSGAAAGNVTAINAAVAAAVAFGGGTVYFPDGIWYINALISITVGIESVSVVSNAKGPTVIMQTQPNTGCFAWTKTDSKSMIQMINLVFKQNSATQVSSQAAVSVAMSGGGPQENIPGFSAINCSVASNFSPSNVNPNTFIYGFSSAGLVNCYYTLCDYTGAGGTPGSQQGTGFYFGPAAGGQPEFNLVVDKCVVCSSYAVVQAPTASNSPQTVMILNSQLVGNDFGVLLGNTTQLVVQGNDFESEIACISCGCTWSGFTPTSSNADATYQSQIVGNLFYVGDGSSPVGCYGICGVIHDSSISNNTFVALPGSGSPSQTMVRLMGDSQHNAIMGNPLQANSSVVGIQFDSGTTNNHTQCNPTLGCTFVDTGTGNSFGTAIP